METCRKIEDARCGAAAQCELIEDVDACRRFARDHCLHGVALEEDPGTVVVDRCVTAIELAGDCAERDGPDQRPSRCRQDYFGDRAEAICEIVQEPELTPNCEFLAVEDEPEERPRLDSPDSGRSQTSDAGD